MFCLIEIAVHKLLPQWLYLKTPFLSFNLKNAETRHGAATSTSHYSSGLDLVPNTTTPLATTCKFQFQRIQHSLLASTDTHIHILIHRHICIIKNKTSWFYCLFPKAKLKTPLYTAGLPSCIQTCMHMYVSPNVLRKQ